MTLLYEELTEKILAAFYTVYNEFGHGYLEKIYGNAMIIELEAMGLSVQAQVPRAVRYRGQVVGEHYLDLVVEGVVVVEIKATETVSPAHEAQLLNYLRATGNRVSLLQVFGKKPEIRRKVI